MLMANILVADDHAMVRTGIRQFLEKDSSIKRVGDAAGRLWISYATAAGSW